MARLLYNGESYEITLQHARQIRKRLTECTEGSQLIEIPVRTIARSTRPGELSRYVNERHTLVLSRGVPLTIVT